MQLLTFSIDGARYGIDLREVQAVIPMPPLRRLDGTPACVAGVLPVLGELLPVIDLCALHVGRPCRRAYGTRIIVLQHLASDGAPHRFGVAAEHVTDVVDVDPARLQPPGVTQSDAPWLGPIAPDESGELIQVVSPDRLMTEQIRGLLFQDAR